MSEKKIKILIIEDEQALVELLKTKLEKEGYVVNTSLDGDDGLLKIDSWKPDLILLDIQMPKVDGYEVLEKMKENDNKTPVIIISNSGQPVELEKTKKLGAVDHLVKTEFSPLDVIRKVRHFLDKGEGEGEKQPIAPLNSPGEKNNGVKVLLVEDDKFLSDICSKKLLKEGYIVFMANDGMRALDMANEADPDIILLDIILPAIDGFQILNQIKTGKNEKLKKTPVIMLSNLGQEDDIKKAMEMGANDYMVKANFTTEEIVKKIKSILGK